MNSGVLSRGSRAFVAGHRGLVGSAIDRRLAEEGHSNLLVVAREDLDLRDQSTVDRWFDDNRPEYVFLVAGTFDGIWANSTRPAEFIYDNLMIHATVVHAAWRTGVKKLLYLGSSCIYPRLAEQPMTEEALLTGALEPTMEAYAAADALVLASESDESWGLVVNEAMASGLPAIVSDQVGCQEDLIRDGETGFSFPLGDERALAACLASLLEDPIRAATMRELAKETVLARCSVEQSVSGTVEALAPIIDRAG